MTTSIEENLYPWEYATTEGGNFKLWKYGPITQKTLHEAMRNIINNQVIINGQNIHVLIFESACAGHGNYGRWDCVNGWTTRIEDAKLKFPRGLHGKESFYHKSHFNNEGQNET